jgi:hypothetical protein
VSYFKKIFLLFYLATLSLAGFSQPEGYGFGKQISINAAQVMGGSPLANFPVMIRFMGASADLNLRTVANGGHVGNINGYDIIFTSDQAGLTILNHQIESYNPVTGEYVAWVRIPSLSNSVNTNIYMYYGNCGISINPSTTSVWNSDFDAVYRLHNDFNDATVNARTGTNTGSTDLSPALIADGQTFGMNDYVQIPSSSISLGQGTISIWSYASTFTGTQYMFGHTSSPTTFVNRIQLYVDDGLGGLDLGFGNNHSLQEGIVTLAPNVWNYVALSWNGTTCSVYVNGVLVHTEAYAGFTALETYLDIGNDGRATGSRNEGWGGGLDHARLSNEIFSGNWIQTEYNNQRAGSTFYTVGAEFNTVRTFYSRASGAWESNLSWSFTSDGSSGAVGGGVFPRRADNVVIQTGHTITINNTNDNGSCPISPDGLGLANVGPFISSNIAMFYQTGDITIAGTLNVTGIEMMVSGYTHIVPTGTFSLASYLVNVGYLEADAASVLSTLDDFVITGGSTTIINTNSTSADDIIVDHTDAILCGTGTATLQNGGGSTITYSNSATVSQVCTSFTINCTGVGCSGFPVVGTGLYSTGNTGPGGVERTDGTGGLVLWLDANTISLANGTNLSSWADQSGYGNNAAAVSGNEPVFNTNQQNGFPDIHFTSANSDYLRVADANSLDPTTVSVFVVGNHSNSSSNNAGYLSKFATSTTSGYQIARNAGNATTRFRIDANGNNVNSTAGAYNTNAILSGIYNKVTLSYFVNENSQGTDNYTTDITANSNFLFLGAATNGSGAVANFLDGDIAESIVIGRNVNNAERTIIDNYLSAKYNIAIAAASDVYTMDNPANGNYDYEVTGFGRASDGSSHRDAKGTGIVRMWNPNGLANSEFLMWGHDNAAITSTTTTAPANVDGTVIQERLSRIWRVSEAGDVGTVSISFDFSGVGGSLLGSNLRLLIDRDGDGFGDNDVTPVAGSVLNGVAVFSNINFQSGDRFTLGNVDASVPLPIELIDFTATPRQSEVDLKWSTASELNNDFFTIQRSRDAENWEDVITVKGAGTVNVRTDYETTDGLPFSGVSYYRLKQTDYDKQYSYSQVRRVELNNEFHLKVYPNPSNGTFTVSTGFEIGLDNIRLTNMVGQTIPIQLQSDQILATLTSQSMTPGIYILQVSKGYWRQSVRVVIE